MIIIYIILFCLIIYAAYNNRHKKQKGYDYLSKDTCNAIKGVFIYFVFVRHIYPYIANSGYIPKTTSDRLFEIIDAQFGQLIVVMFLFYSGYGIMESFKKKGNNYLKSFPYRRIFITWANFAIAVFAFALMNILLGLPLNFKQTAFSFIGWLSIGNSNWYIFTILLLYIITYLSYRIPIKISLITKVLIISILFMIALSFVKANWWYDTMLSYPAGMLFSHYKSNIEYYLNNWYFTTLICISIIFFTIHFGGLPPARGFTFNFESIAFALFIVTLSWKIDIKSKALCWLGANLFPLYIYQRIPMITLRELTGDSFLVAHPYIYILSCAIISLLISYFYKYWRIQPH